jgi:hypothetical protein
MPKRKRAKKQLRTDNPPSNDEPAKRRRSKEESETVKSTYATASESPPGRSDAVPNNTTAESTESVKEGEDSQIKVSCYHEGLPGESDKGRILIS